MHLELLERARSEGAPLIDGERVTFVWYGRQMPYLVGDFTEWEDGKPVQMSQTAEDVWTYQIELPSGAYVEYAYRIGNRQQLDPLNPRTIDPGFGDKNNYFYMPDGAPTPLASRGRGVARGVVTHHTLKNEYMVVGGKRRVTLYEPCAKGPYPLLVVWDGREYLRRARLAAILDNLIARGRIYPVAVAMVDNAGKARSVEYACSEAPVDFLLHSVLPLAYEHLDIVNVSENPGAYGVLGASSGGLMALFTALRAPHIFGNVLSQSGAFSSAYHDFVVYELVRLLDPLPLKIWMDVGQFEWLLETNRRMHGLLLERGYDVSYHEYPAGHNYTAWRNDLWRGLESIFGRPGIPEK